MPELTPEAQRCLDAAVSFAREIIEPQAEGWERNGGLPREFFRQAADAGLCGITVPQALGGWGLSATAACTLLERMAAHDFASSFALVVHNNLCASIARNGTTQHIERYLRPMMAGEAIGAFLLTEPQGGSDAAAIETHASKIPAGWQLEGAKAWVSNATVADVLSVYAQTVRGSGAHGIACFLLPAATAGVTRKAPYALVGGHALNTGGIDLAGCAVDDDALMIAPGEAFKGAMQAIDFARLTVAAMCCGMLQRALSVAVEFTTQRRAFGQPVYDFQAVQWLLADASTDLEAARLLTYKATAMLDRETVATVAAAHAKKFASKMALTRIADCMQAMGAPGYSREFPLARHFECAKMTQFVDGTSEIQNLVIARALRKGLGSQ